MKPKKQKSANSEAALDAGKPLAPGLPTSRRRWWFPLAALAVPFICLLLLEALLRLFGYGYSTGFFLKSRTQGREVWIENPDFTRRFFPPGLERTPEPLSIAAAKPVDTCRIFILGESAALGDPEPSFGFGRILQTLLPARYPEKKFEVVNVAVTAINSHVVRQIARDCAPRQGDIWIVYMGNNEVVGPFGAGTVFGAQTPSLAFIRASLSLKATRTGQLFDALRWRLANRKGVPTSWEGMEMFLQQQVPQDDPRMPVVYAHFQRNLEDILNVARAVGAHVLLSTVVSNLKDCPPFASLHRPELSATQLAEWNRLFQAATNHEAAKDYPAALAQYQQALHLDDRHAELHFRLGRCQVALGQHAEARKSFARARDLDTLRFRADTEINQIIRQAAIRRDGRQLKFVDAIAAFARQSPDGIAGEELLYEHVHPNFSGHYLLARTLAAEMASVLPASTADAATNQGSWLSADECARRLAYTDWNRYQVVDEMVKRLQLPPFTHQLDHAARLERLKRVLADLEPALRRESIGQAIEIYRQALALSPDDWVLHQNFAKLLQWGGDLAPAAEQWRQVLRLMPHHLEAYYNLGSILDSQGKPAEAIACFQEALRRRPGLPEAQNGLGLALANLGHMAEAMRHYQSALRQRPQFAEAHVNLGQILAVQGKVDEAMVQYATALRYNSNSAAAHINIGKLLATQGKTAEAVDHYQTAVRLKPDNAIAHYNLGNALTTLSRSEAIQHYAEAVRLKPDFAEARYNLGLGLAKQGRNDEALAQFAEVVRLKPESAEAHFNLGVALAKERRFTEAVTHFQETLRLEPTNAKAKQFLEQAQTRLKQDSRSVGP